MFISEITIENFRFFEKLSLPLRPGLTALVGPNDAGKTAIVDALRLALGTRDQEYSRIEDSDFHIPPVTGKPSTEIRIQCKFEDLSLQDQGALAEYLTYESQPVLYINWIAKKKPHTVNRRSIFSECKSGKAADGPTLDVETRDLLRGTYLRPLRDAEQAMSAGRGSRLSQILHYTDEIRTGEPFDRKNPIDDITKLSILGVGDYTSHLLESHEGIKVARTRLNEQYLKELLFTRDKLAGHISVSHISDDDARLKHLLERLVLAIGSDGDLIGAANRGLGSNNLLFMSCELLLLGSEKDGFPLLLLEEPEAHLHPQRQLRLMQFLQKKAEGSKIQAIITTHSPNLASAIKLENLVLVQDGHAYPLTKDKTRLEGSDYSFLERFLDVTKANLFFACGVIIVEGDGENILLPTLARLIGRDFTEHGVSIVNVGSTGLRRFARIFQRKNEQEPLIKIPIACLADMDVMPDCAVTITGKVKDGQPWPEKNDRRWRAKSDYPGTDLEKRRDEIRQKASGQNVETFVSDEWTLEYDLAFFGLAKDVWIAAHLAKNDEQIHEGKKNLADIEKEASASFTQKCAGLNQEELASTVYALFTTGTKASKAIAAQYLAQRLEDQIDKGTLTKEGLVAKLPPYLVSAIECVTTYATEECATDGKADAGTPPGVQSTLN